MKMNLGYRCRLTKNKNQISTKRSEVKMAIRYKSHDMNLISGKESRFKGMIRQEIFFKFCFKVR